MDSNSLPSMYPASIGSDIQKSIIHGAGEGHSDLFSLFFLNNILQDASSFLSTYISSCQVARNQMKGTLCNLPKIHIKTLEPKLLLSIPFRMPFNSMVIIMTPCPRSSLISLWIIKCVSYLLYKYLKCNIMYTSTEISITTE